MLSVFLLTICTTFAIDTIWTTDRALDGTQTVQNASNINCLSNTTILYVNPNATGIPEDGLSWSTAYSKLQPVLNKAMSMNSLTEIWVAQGNYFPTEDNPIDDSDDARGLSFYINKDIKIYGGFSGSGVETNLNERDWIAYPTILDGDLGVLGDSDDNAYNLLVIDGNAAGPITNDFVIDGFIIQNGHANHTDVHKELPIRGGGIHNFGKGLGSVCSPRILNCSFLNNSASFGGAIYNNGDTGGESNPIFTNCSFSNNLAKPYGGAICNDGESGNTSPVFNDCNFNNNTADLGGAVYYFAPNGIASPKVTNCTFSNNTANFSGGAIYNYASNGLSNSVLTSCFFSNNTSTFNGGAIFHFGRLGSSNLNLANCSFSNNTAIVDGGAIYTYGQVRADLANCSFIDNTSTDNGGAVYSRGDDGTTSTTFNNCQFISNTSTNGVGGVFGYNDSDSGQPIFTNCSFFGNTAKDEASGGVIGTTILDKSKNPPILENSITWGNSSTFGFEPDKASDATLVIKTSLTQESECPTSATCQGQNVFGQDPLFESVVVGMEDLRLKFGSPAMNVGDNATTIGAGIDLDYSGNNRIINGFVDLGAFENVDFPDCSSMLIFQNSTIVPPGIYHAAQSIEASNLISSNETIVFLAGDEVIIKKGFQVSTPGSGFTFIVDIDDCPPSNGFIDSETTIEVKK